MLTRYTAAEQAAVEKAERLNGAALVQVVGKNRYTVPSESQPPRLRNVTVSEHGFTCDCQAAGLPACWHRASVWLYRRDTPRSEQAAALLRAQAKTMSLDEINHDLGLAK